MKPINQRRRKMLKRLRKLNLNPPANQFVLDVDYKDSGDSWASLQEYVYQPPEHLAIKGVRTISNEKIHLHPSGRLNIPQGFRFNASGPTIDTPDAIRATMIHDAFYTLSNQGLIPNESRRLVDKIFYNILIEDGMDPTRARVWYMFVRAFGWYYWNTKE